MDNSSFKGLPAEIRNEIYAYALFEQDGVEIHSEPALLQTCHQIRGEASLMFWAINRFEVDIHEDHQNHGLYEWLEKAGARLGLVQSFTVHIEMPSVGLIEDEANGANSVDFLMHIVDTLRQADWGRRHLETVVKFTLNGACDSEAYDKIDAMSPGDQDRFRGSKFLLLCLVHGVIETAEAVEAIDGEEWLEKKDEQINQRRLAHASSKPT